MTRRILYFQRTLGAPHIARIKALDAQPGVSCRGVALAAQERTRSSQLDAESAAWVHTILEGTYEALPLWAKLSAVCRYVRAEQPCALIIDAVSDPVLLIAGRYAQRLGSQVILRWASTYADNPRTFLKEKAKRLFYRGWGGYAVTGSRGAEYLKSFGVPRSKMALCGNPVGGSGGGAGDALPGEPAVVPRRNTFLFVGRFLPLKNLSLLLRAYADYRSQGGCWGLVLIGFGQTEEAVRAQAASLPDIEFYGHLQQAELLPHYAQEGCLVLPSYSENWGLVVNEALHAGMPVVVSEVCGCVPELVRHGTNGLIVEPYDQHGWTQAMTQVSSLAALERARWGECGRALAASQTPEGWAQQVMSLL